MARVWGARPGADHRSRRRREVVRRDGARLPQRRIDERGRSRARRDSAAGGATAGRDEFMIPKRVKLSGFLCYKDEQEVAFDGSTLWMLSGLNGSGKSAVFDAVTYALFGYHRGGSVGAAELINKSENGFTVEFDFQLEGQVYRIRRTLKRRASGTAATQQILKFQPAGEDFEPIVDTQKRAEFDKWVSDHIGLNYETFTSSVLLLQGRAEKLLDSTAKGRAEVLASIVDLERYQRLHEKADGERKKLKGQVEELQAQVNAIPEVSEMELAAAANKIDDASDALAAAHEVVERLQGLEFQTRQWVEVQRKLSAAQARRAAAAQLIREADRIEQQAARLKELRDVLPHVDRIGQSRGGLSRSEEATKTLVDRQRDLQAKQFDLEHQLSQAERRKANVQKGIATDEEKLARTAERLPLASAALEQVKQIEKKRAELSGLEADRGKYPGDVRAKVTDAEAAVNELVALERALTPLGRLADARSELRAARERAADGEKEESTSRERGEEIRKQQEVLKPQLEAARATLKQVEEKLASERALLKQATELREEFDRLDGSKTCRACGQELTRSHFRAEKARRDEAVADVQARFKKAQRELKDAQATEEELSEQLAKVEQQLQAAREDFKLARAHLQQSQKDAARLAGECQRSFMELAEPFRQRLAEGTPADWLKTTFPTSAELDEARRSLLRLPTARRDLEQVQELLSCSNKLAAQIEMARRS